MRKLILGVLVILSFLISIVGCSTKGTVSKDSRSLPNSATSSATVNQTQPTDTKSRTIENLSSKAETEYNSKKFGLSMIFPESWKDKYIVEEDDSGITVYFKPGEKAKDEYSGQLFSIVKKTDDLPEWMYDTVGERYFKKDDVTFLIGGPTDVSFPPEHPEFMTFSKMQQEIPEVLKTLK